MSSPSTSSSRMITSGSSESTTMELVRVKEEPIFPNEEPEPLIIKSPGQAGTTTDFLLGTFKTVLHWSQNLPRIKKKQRIAVLEQENFELKQEVAMKSTVVKIYKQSRRESEMKLMEKAEERFQEVQDHLDDELYYYSGELKGVIEEWKEKHRISESEAHLAQNQLREVQMKMFAVEHENVRLKKQLESAKKSKEYAQKQISELNARVARRNVSLKYAVADVNKYRNRLKASETEKKEALKKLEEMELKPAIKPSQATYAENSHDELRGELNKTKEELEKANDAAREILDKFAIKVAAIENLKKEVTARDKKITVLQDNATRSNGFLKAATAMGKPGFISTFVEVATNANGPDPAQLPIGERSENRRKIVKFQFARSNGKNYRARPY